MSEQFKEKISESNGNDNQLPLEEGREEAMVEKSDSLEIIAPKGLKSLEGEVQHIEKHVALFNRIKIASLKLTRPEDWVLQSGSPYLMERGAQTIAIAWGVNIYDIDVKMEWMEDDNGRYYMFIAKGKATARKLNRTIEDEGTCSQRDKFFGKVGKNWAPIEDVDMTNVRKKAITNLYGRLIKRVTGLINVTADDLKAAGIKTDKMTKIEYGKGRKKAAKRLSKKALEKRDKLWKICLELAAGDDETASAELEECSAFKNDEGKQFKVTDVKDLKSEKWIDATYGRAKEKLDKAYGSGKND